MKRKKKEVDDSKESKTKKYKRKIENPEKQKARYVYDNKGESGKVWEKNRRDRLNKTFDELALLLPPKDPPGKLSKIEILSASIKHFETLSDKLLKIECELKALKEKNSRDEDTCPAKKTKDNCCNTDILETDKENSCLMIDKNVQVNLIRKKKSKTKNGIKNRTETLSSGVQTDLSLTSISEKSINLEMLDEPVKYSTFNVSELNVSSNLSIIPNHTSSSSLTRKKDDTTLISAPHLSSSVKVTPALISTPIMTPSLFISNYPFVVSQIPQSVYIVNNKTEVTTTVNKVCAVKSKSITGRVPLPPLKKTVAVKKVPRKKRLLKKKFKIEKKMNEISNEEQIKSAIDNEIQPIEIEKSGNNLENETVASKNDSQIPNEHNKNQALSIAESVEICNFRPPVNKLNTEESTLSKNTTGIEVSHSSSDNAITTIPASTKTKLNEKLPLSPVLLSLDSSQKTAQSHDTSSVNDTSAISNLDLDNFSLLTDNILSSMENSEPNNSNISAQLTKSFDKDNVLVTSNTQTSVVNEKYTMTKIVNSGKNIDVLDKMEKETSVSKTQVPSIQIRKGLYMDTSSSLQNKIDPVIIASNCYNQGYNSLNVNSSFTFSLSNTTTTISPDKTTYPIKNFPQSNSRFDTIGSYTTTYTTTGSSYTNSFNYGSYYSGAKTNTSDVKSHANFQHPYSSYVGNVPINVNNTQPSSVPSQYPTKTYDSQRPFYVEQPSINFTFSLTSVPKTQSKYTTSSVNKNPSHIYVNPQEPCKKPNMKNCNYNYNLENSTARTLSSHTIARLNSKYEHHKENDVPFYINQDINYSKITKPNVHSASLANNPPCVKYSTIQQSQTKQQLNNKSAKISSSTNHTSQFSTKYDVDWMSSSEIKPSSSDFQLFTPMELSQTSTMNQSYYSPVSNFDLNRKTSDLYFAHPPGEENIPWSPSRISNVLDTSQLGSNQCFPTTLPNLHGDLALNTISTNSNKSNNILDTPTKMYPGSCSSTFNIKETKRSNSHSDSQNSSFSVRQLVDSNSNKNIVNDKTASVKRKTVRKEGDIDSYSNEIIPFDNHKTNIYSAESLINSRNSKSKSNWHSDSHIMSQDLNLSSTIFSNVDTLNDQYNYSSSRYDPKLFNQNYVSSFVDNSLSNSTQNFHNFTKNQPFSFGDGLNSTIDFLQSSIGGSVSSFLSHSETNTEKSVQNSYSDTIKGHSTNIHLHPSKTNPSINTSTNNIMKKSKSLHQSAPSHHSLLMNYDFPVPPVTPSLTYFPTHDWKSTTTESYQSCSNSYMNNMNLYSQNIIQNSQSQNNNLVPLPGNTVQNSSNSLTNFNLSSICPEINDKVRQQTW